MLAFSTRGEPAALREWLGENSAHSRKSLLRGLILAIDRDDVDSASVLVERGAPLCPGYDFRHPAPLAHAASAGALACVKWLLRFVGAGLRVDRRDKRGRTALHAAAKRGSVAIIEALVAAGAALEARDERGMTPFLLATAHGNSAAARALAAAGADTSARNTDKEGVAELTSDPALLTEFGACGPHLSSSAVQARLASSPPGGGGVASCPASTAPASCSAVSCRRGWQLSAGGDQARHASSPQGDADRRRKEG